ncbi:internal (core) protein A [Yersinia phage fPS-59]|uniref:Internal (Core) protein A n=1 Tax=Yersinia phage fPS-59 TaxID=2052754 RepID=A0A2D0PEG2_9CAUD|nr:internal virion protein [Yersinia phage fPS-59]SOO46823.1 internal (core) protein A [Yersinia phage fPS-59]
MYLRIARPIDFDLFKPSHDDLREAEELGVTPSYPPAHKCVVIDRVGYPLAVGGMDGDQVWFITSSEVWRLDHAEKREFRKLIMEYRDIMVLRYGQIWNYVWTGNKNHVRFLKSIGAVFHNEYTGDSNQFQLFTIGG